MATNLTPDQINNIYTARPDLQTYYAKGDPKNKGTTSEWGINNWWNKYGVKENPGLIGTAPAAVATAATPAAVAPTSYSKLDSGQMQQLLASGAVEHDAMKWKKNPEKLASWYTRYLAKGGKNIFDASQVLSADNVASTVSSPAPVPDDLLGIRNQVYADQGISAMQQEAQKLSDALMNYDNASEQGQKNIYDELKTMGVLRGEDAAQQWQRGIGRSAMARSLDAVNQRLSTSIQNANDIVNIKTDEAKYNRDTKAEQTRQTRDIMLQYPDASINFEDSTQTIALKIKNSNEKKTVVDLFTQTFGYFPTGLSQESMNSQLAKKYKSEKAYKEVLNNLNLQKIQGTDALTLSENKDKAQKKSDDAQKVITDYVESIARDVKSGVIPDREEAARTIEKKYPGWGSTIYQYVSDNYSVAKQVPGANTGSNPFG